MKGPVLAAVAISAAAVVLVLSMPRPVLSHETVTTTVLFDREIVQILNRHCVMCHVEGGPSFPLAAYDEVWLQKRKISAAVLARHMPPWAAMPGYGRFANENAVTLRESQFIVSWMEGLGPRNAGQVFSNIAAPGGATRAAVRAHADFGVWQLGQPDLTRELDAVFVEPGRPDDVIRSSIDLGTNVDLRVRAFEYMPGDRRVVRAAVFTVQETGQWIGSWTPWYGFVKLPANAAHRLPPGAHIVAEIHYRHTHERVVDRGRIGLFFSDDSSAKSVSDVVVTARPASDATGGLGSARRLHGESTVASDTALLALRPDLVAGLTSVEVAAHRADGGTDVLLFAKDVPQAWPTPYIFKDPVVVRRGTRLSVTAYVQDASAPSDGVRVTVSGYPAGRSVPPQR
jgi:mono/diheme cytochrome c family protein